MLKKILAVLLMLCSAAAFAAVDVNTAKAADLDGLKGIGPVMSKRILDERKKGKFKDWPDLIARVKGLGDNSASRLSTEGLTVNGDAFKAAGAMKKEEKKDAKATAAKPAASAKK
jgi:competence protein ComEA